MVQVRKKIYTTYFSIFIIKESLTFNIYLFIYIYIFFRGESHGKKGIFPSNFVEVIDKNAKIPNVEKNPNCQTNTEADSQPIQAFQDSTNYNVLSEHLRPSDEMVESTNDALVDAKDPSSNHSKEEWKNIKIDDDELFNDDYFKLNMPNIYASSKKNDKFKTPSYSSTSENDANEHKEMLVPLDSLSAEVDKYLSSDAGACDMNLINQDLIDIDFAYTEDNTGINPYGRAVFSFTAQYANELSFRKGDILHLIRHVDSHWTVGKLGINKGIFPTSYIDIIVDCPYKAEVAFEKRSESSSMMKKAIVCFDFEASAPEDVSGKEGDLVLITKFVSENWVEVETIDGQCGWFPLNRLNVLEDDLQATKFSALEIDTKRAYSKEDFPLSKKGDIEEALSKNLSSLDFNLKYSKPAKTSATTTASIFGECSEEDEEPLSKPIAADVSLQGPPPPPKEEETPAKPRQLPVVPPRTKIFTEVSTEVIPSPAKEEADEVPSTPPKREISLSEVLSSKNISNDVSLKSSEFPEDVSSSSLSQRNSSLKDNGEILCLVVLFWFGILTLPKEILLSESLPHLY